MTHQTTISENGIYHSIMLHDQELRILTNALMALDRGDQKIIEQMYGKVEPLYNKLLYPLQEGYKQVQLKPKPVRHGGDLDALT